VAGSQRQTPMRAQRRQASPASAGTPPDFHASGRRARQGRLLCLSRGPDDISVAAVLGLRGGCSDRLSLVLRTRQGWAAPGGACKLLLGHAQQVRDGAGDGRRIVRRPAGSRQPDIGSGRPRSFRALAAGRAEVAAGLAGDVALEAADDLRLGLPFGGAAPGTGAGGRVRAQPGEHDPP